MGCVATFLACFLGLPAQAEVSEGPAKTRVVINIPAAKLRVFEGERLVQTYPVGVGQPKFPTPTGRFRVIRKVLEPGWENPYLKPGQVQIQSGQGNPLGTRWIGFNPGPAGEYGIHGTDNPTSVGQFRSHGCVRMHNKHVVDLFERVRLGTPVQVIYEPFELRTENDRLILETYPDVYRRKPKGLASLVPQIRRYQPQRSVASVQAQLAKLSPAQRGKIDLGPVASPVQLTATSLPKPPIVLSGLFSPWVSP